MTEGDGFFRQFHGSIEEFVGDYLHWTLAAYVAFSVSRHAASVMAAALMNAMIEPNANDASIRAAKQAAVEKIAAWRAVLIIPHEHLHALIHDAIDQAVESAVSAFVFAQHEAPSAAAH